MKIIGMVLHFLIFLSNPGHAGSWIGSGGEIIKDAHNPWFLQTNNSQVTYCLLADRSHFSLPIDTIGTVVRKAFDFWDYEFSEAAGGPQRARPFTNNFHQVSCDQDHVDLVFQFGVIRNAKQWRFIQDPRKYVGLAVRTDYNPKSLRGQGFIYISPDSGPLRFRSGTLDEDIWSKNQGQALYQVLVHELGHVLGIQHVHGTLMQPDYPELVVRHAEEATCMHQDPSQKEKNESNYPTCSRSHDLWDDLEGGRHTPFFFSQYLRNAKTPKKPGAWQGVCRGEDNDAHMQRVAKFFGVSLKKGDCLSARRQKRGLISVYLVRKLEDRSTSWQLVGTIRQQGAVEKQSRVVSTLYVTAEQEVFDIGLPGGQPQNFVAPTLYTKQVYEGLYQSPAGIQRKVLVRIKHGLDFKISAFIEGKIFIDIL